MLTVICSFSRFCWLIPLKEKTAPEVAKGLLRDVFLDLAGFPAVLRSDNASEFVSEVVAIMNAELGVHHITGSSYHPQSQGMVERMHRTLNDVMTALVRDYPDTWELRLKPAQFVLRVSPSKALGGRSPYEVVTGMRVKLPSAMVTGHRVQDMPKGRVR